jgi:hypothetical protein
MGSSCGPRARVRWPFGAANQASPSEARWASSCGWSAARANQAIFAGKRWPDATRSTRGWLSAPRTTRPLRVDDAADDGLDAGHGREVVDAVLAEVVGADVGDDGGAAAVDGEAAAEDAAARDLEDGDVDAGVAQDDARGAGAGPVALLDHALVDRQAVGRGVAGDQAGGAGDAGEHPRGRGLAVGAGDQGDGDAAERGPVDVLGDMVFRPGDGAAAVADRQAVVVEQDREVAGDGGGHHGGAGGLVIAGVLGAPGRELVVQVAGLADRGGDGPVLHEGREVEGVDGGGEHEVGAEGVRAGGELHRPAERGEGAGDVRAPAGQRGVAVLTEVEGHLGDRAGRREVEVRAGESAAVLEAHRGGLRGVSRRCARCGRRGCPRRRRCWSAGTG